MSKIFGTDSLQEVWSSIARNRRRSLLTAFGVFWGMFMLVVMLSMGNGITNSIMGDINFIPSNMTICWTDVTSIPWEGFRKGRKWNLKSSDIALLKKEIPELELISPQVSNGTSVKVVNRDKSKSYSVKGVDNNFAKVCPLVIIDGRYINEMDVKLCRKVCVLGQKIVDEVYGGISPVGKYVQVGGVSYQCVGVVNRTSQNMTMGGPDEKTVTLPYNLVQRLYNLGDVLGMVMIQAKPEVKIDAMEKRLREVICAAHQVCPEDTKALTFMNLDKLLQTFRSLCLGITALLWIVGLGTLFSGAIGVSNIVMITVKERTREIGVRRAIGARPLSIISQIMSESLVLTSAAGILGLMSGVLLMTFIGGKEIHIGDSDMTLVNPMIDFSTGIAALVVIIIIGLAAGILPAVRAMKIKAIDAIREE